MYASFTLQSWSETNVDIHGKKRIRDRYRSTRWKGREGVDGCLGHHLKAVRAKEGRMKLAS